MKLIFKIILFNLIFIFLILLLFEYIFYKNDIERTPFIKIISEYDVLPFSKVYELIVQNNYYTDDSRRVSYIKFRRPLIYKPENQKPIILFGCSFAWGYMLKEHQTFQYKLFKEMKRSIYNRAQNGWAPQHMLFQLKNEDFYQSMPEPEYIIYLYIPSHVLRIYKYPWIYKWGAISSYGYFKYNKTRNGMKEERRLKNIPYSRIYNKLYLPAITNWEKRKEGFEFLEMHFTESKKEVEKHWKNIKFVIFDFDFPQFEALSYTDVINGKNLNKLREDGFIVIKASELINKEFDDSYTVDINRHPNEKVWEIITPLFVKKLSEYK